MHELALLGSVVKAVEDACSTADASVVKAAEASLVKAAETSVVKTVETSVVKVVALRVGAMCGAVPAALEWAWPLAVAGSVAEGAELLLEEVPAAVWCPACDAEREIDTFYALRCPVCGQPTADLVRGREFLVSYVELDVPDDHG